MSHLLVAKGLKKSFVTARSLLGVPTEVVHSVRGVDLQLDRGETLALVGESGSGKSTTCRLLLQLIRPDEGSVSFDGEELTELRGAALRRLRSRIQMVFQDPIGSLDPTRTIQESLAEPVVVHEGRHAAEDRARFVAALDLVGLPEGHLARYPKELSGGQLQRVSIARAMIVKPDLVVCDEVVSALDVSTQAQVLNLLKDIQQETGVAYLFVTHDLSVIPSLAHRVSVMHLGQIVEQGPVDKVFARAVHPYTESLLSAVPLPDPRRQRERTRIVLDGEVPSPTDPPPGCSFHTRCHEELVKECWSVEPPLVSLDEEVRAACHVRAGHVGADPSAQIRNQKGTSA